MAIRIVGVDLPQNKRGEIALTYVYGIGRSSSAKILDKAGVDRDLKVKDWTDDQAAKIREIIGAEYKVEGDLRSEIQLNIKRLMDIGCYRGVRHRLGLPVRGQSTKNNARTRKGSGPLLRGEGLCHIPAGEDSGGNPLPSVGNEGGRHLQHQRSRGGRVDRRPAGPGLLSDPSEK